jgi:hypothetical protein
MTREEIHDRIEAYLNGTLSPEDMQRMAQDILQDRSLAEEVELHRSLQSMLEDHAYLNLRRNLDEITGADMPLPDSGKPKPKNWLLIVGLGLILMVLVWIFVPWPSSNPIPPAPSSIPEETFPIPLPGGDLPVETTPQADTPAMPHRQDIATIPPDPFKPLARLEQSLQLPANPSFEISDAEAEFLAGTTSGTWQVIFRAQMLTAYESPTLQLHIINNQGELINQLPVSVRQVDEDTPVRAFARKTTFLLRAEETIRMRPGLYYMRLLRPDQQDYLWTSRVEVR